MGGRRRNEPRLGRLKLGLSRTLENVAAGDVVVVDCVLAVGQADELDVPLADADTSLCQAVVAGRDGGDGWRGGSLTDAAAVLARARCP